MVDKAPEEWILIFHLLKGKSLNKLMAQAALAATVYWIWAERNKIMYGEDKYGHNQLFRLITRDVTIRMASLKGRFKDTAANKLAAKQLGRLELIRQPLVKILKWKKPENGWFKLNADGSLSSNNAGYGGLIRNEDGCVKLAYTASSNTRFILFLELMGIAKGLKIALEVGVRKLCINSDSRLTIQILRGQALPTWRTEALIAEMKSNIERFEEVTIMEHIYRQVNRAAD